MSPYRCRPAHILEHPAGCTREDALEPGAITVRFEGLFLPSQINGDEVEGHHERNSRKPVIVELAPVARSE